MIPSTEGIFFGLSAFKDFMEFKDFRDYINFTDYLGLKRLSISAPSKPAS